MTSPRVPGTVITFYSYKGGSGRTMALANVGCLLAEGGGHDRSILMIDWDLEAPGLHRYFAPLLRNSLNAIVKDAELIAERREFLKSNATVPVRYTPAPGDELLLTGPSENRLNHALNSYPGLIDLFDLISSRLSEEEGIGRGQTLEQALDMLSQIDIAGFILQTDKPGLFLLKAGRFDTETGYHIYGERVNRFSWLRLYERSPYLFQAFALYLTKRFDFVLVDARTGFTDTGGICTMLMPEKLVVAFTPNRQSLVGLHEFIKRAIAYRKSSADLRPLSVFPLPSRIEMTAPREFRDGWRYGGSRLNQAGWQPQFEELFKFIYRLEECSLEDYFNEVQIYHFPEYSFGEAIAVTQEVGNDPASLRRRYKSFTERLIALDAPWEALGEPGRLAIAEGRLRAREQAVAVQRQKYRQLFAYLGVAVVLVALVAAWQVRDIIGARILPLFYGRTAAVILIDSSGSTGPFGTRPLAAELAAESVRTIVNSLPTSTVLEGFTFSDHPRSAFAQTLLGLTEGRDSQTRVAVAAMTEEYAGRQTCLGSALRTAATALRKYSSGQWERRLYLLSDLVQDCPNEPDGPDELLHHSTQYLPDANSLAGAKVQIVVPASRESQKSNPRESQKSNPREWAPVFYYLGVTPENLNFYVGGVPQLIR